MNTETHIIRRQKFSVLHHGNTNVLALQQVSEQFCKERLLPALEKMLDTVSDGKTIYIPQFNLDLSVGSLHDLNELLVHDIVEQVKKEVMEAKRASHRSAPVDGDFGVIRNFLFYLKNGVLSGNDSFLHRNIWIENIVGALVRINTKGLDALRDALLTSKAQANLAALNSDELFWATLTIVMPGQTSLSRLKILYNEWRQLVSKYTIHFPTFQVKMFFAKYLLNGGDSKCQKTFAKMEDLLDSVKDHSNQKQIPTLIQLNNEIIEASLPEPVEKDRKESADENENKEANLEQSGSPIYVPNAGLIIMHPFISNFFTNIGLQWKNGILEKERAVTLLHHIATGSTTAEPYELVLPKLLLDIPLEDTIVPTHIISEIEKSEVDNLMKAVINHWRILKNTSPGSLRQSFLQRNGIANEKDGRYSLAIERGPYDVVLDHLPWTISMIKLPWMKRVMNVEWISN